MTELKDLNEIRDLAAISIGDMRDAYLSKTPGKRLLLPTIQRSLVWDNKRIVDYWDTLYRGWFPGLMMVRKFKSGIDAYSAGAGNSQATKTADGDLELFDGQQRMAAILLGFGEGPLAETHRLWFGVKNGSRPMFRVSTKGQPFGYNLENPNSKLELRTRRDALDAFIKRTHPEASEEMEPVARAEAYGKAFGLVTGDQLPGAKDWSWHQLSDLWGDELIIDGITQCELEKIRNIRVAKIAVKALSGELSDENDYEEFFRRTGQGGVALTDDELTYSIIKKRFPEARPTFEKTAHDEKIGALASATHMALGTLRLARMTTATVQDDNRNWAGRPTPDWVRKLPESDEVEPADHLERTARDFRQMLEPTPENSRRQVEILLEDVRRLLVGDETTEKKPGDNHLPRMMLSGLPKEMIDISLMLVGLEALKGVSEMNKRAFVLWTLLFADPGAVAWQLAAKSQKLEGLPLLREVISEQEMWNKSLPVPSAAHLETLQNRPSADELRAPEQWFRVDAETNARAIHFLSGLHFQNRTGKALLIFLQRKYIEDNFPGYDPTSGRDEDLPIDLDHIIARKHFHFHWSTKKLPNDLSEEQTKRFGEVRKKLSDQIGNLRWLCASENRKKGAGPCEPLGEPDRTSQEKDELRSLGDILSDPDGVKDWTADDLLRFQDIVLKRTARLAAEFIDESGIRDLTAFEAKAE